ncbi:hypothetical protein [Vogesella sp. LIG4]|uniref:hypothetical protein n=1 Tax=Vogesella sp. LIG4 TaxID=1192162 RepID=UPI00081FE59F|nr:hypothetical protein [Vogesella sp. LIG4]SCK30799.1 conserved hypothetical protein [Vogesella sp. LIG4]
MPLSCLLRSVTTRLCGTLLLALPAAARAASPLDIELTWVTLGSEPYTISSGKLAGQGVMDLIVAAIHPRLSSRPPQQVHAMAARIEMEMHKPGTRCTTSLLPTPTREQYLIFSQPYEQILPNGLITLKWRQHFLTPYRAANNTIQLSKLLQNPGYKLGVSMARAFGGSINTVLQPYLDKQAGNVVQLSGITNLKMRRSGRIDFFLGYPYDQYDNVGVPNEMARDTVFLPLAEGGGLLPATMACQRTEQGKQVVALFNSLLQEDKALRRSLVVAYERWLSPSAIVTLHNMLRQEATQ